MTAVAPLPFLVPGDPEQLTGGYGYDRRIAAGLAAQGWSVRLLGLDGAFPLADATARRSADTALSALADDAVVVIDGLAGCGLPEVLAAHADRLRIVVVVHHPLADESGLTSEEAGMLFERERRALAVARAVVVTSPFTARRLRDYGVGDARIVEPGTDPAPPAAVRDAPPWRLLCVATLTPRKGHDTLVAALARLRRHDWHCRLVGAMDAAPAHAARVRATVAAYGLGERIEFVGAQPPAVLARYYADADVFVLPTRYEGYGMALAEALARGLPVVAGSGGAVRDTVPPDAGLLVAPGDAGALADAIEAVFTGDERRTALRRGAMAARARLPAWPEQVARFAAVLDGVAA